MRLSGENALIGNGEGIFYLGKLDLRLSSSIF